MSEELVKSVLKEYAENNTPSHPNLSPRILKQVHVANQSRIAPLSSRLRLAFNPRPLMLGGTLALLVVTLWSITTLTQPASVVSAEEIVARAAQVAQVEPGAEIRNFHGVYISRYRHDPNGPFSEERQETWFQAPDKYAHKSNASYSNGLKTYWATGADGAAVYQYSSEIDWLRLSDLDTFYLRDPNTTTLQVRPFAPTDLESVMESVRLKLPPARDSRSAPRPPYAYDVKLLGERQMLGRTAYVLELTLVPGASLQLPDSQVPDKIEMWVDKQVYAVLRLEGWNAEGIVLRSGAYESFEINANTQFDVLSSLAPPGTDIVDTRPITDTEMLDLAWGEATRRAPFTAFTLANTANGLEPGRPFYDARRQAISQQYQGKVFVKIQGVIDASGRPAPPPEWSVTSPETGQVRQVVWPKLIITQGPPTSITADGLGEAVFVQVGSLKGRFYIHDGSNTLIFDRDGTRIKLYAQKVLGEASAFTQEELVKIAETLAVVEKK